MAIGKTGDERRSSLSIKYKRVSTEEKQKNAETEVTVLSCYARPDARAKDNSGVRGNQTGISCPELRCPFPILFRLC